MQVAVMGAGAIGCFHGGHLARAGHKVTLIGRPVHVAAIRANGLLFETKDFKGYVPASASEEAAAVAGADLVLVAIDGATLGDALRWEVSRGGALFPHLYAELPITAALWVKDLPLGPDGKHQFPELA